VLLNDDESTSSGTEGHPGTQGVAHEGTATTETGGNDAENPPPFGPPMSDDGSDSDVDEDYDDVAGDNDAGSEIPDEEVYHPDTMTPSVHRTYGVRPKIARDYSHMFSHATAMHHAMKQYSLKKGQKKFQKVVEEAVSK
jgi:hypothetical protein